MERSNPDDRADDPSDDGGADGAFHYPLAPLPKHERQWRHPSEVGQQAWVMSEPPIALGRGLLVTTSAIGSAIGLAILWMLLPVGGSAPVANPVVTGRVNTVAPRSPADRDTSTTAFATSSELVTPSSTVQVGSLPPVLTLPAEDVPSNTVLLHAAESVEQSAIAVLIGDSITAEPLMLTTANAVGDDTELSVVLDSGATSMATVVEITDSLAFLRPLHASEAETPEPVGFATSAAAQPGEVLHVLAAEPIAFTFDGNRQLGAVLDRGVVEGTPVVNANGALVALCSHDEQGVVFVPVPAPPGDAPGSSVDGSTPDGVTSSTSTTTAPTTTSAPGPGTGTTIAAPSGEAWLGVRLAPVADGQPGVLVQSVGAGSPAARAGFAAGQRILAIDGEQVATAEDVAAILQEHRPGDVILVTVALAAPGGNTSTTVAPTTTAASSTPSSPTSPTAPSTSAPTTTAPPGSSSTVKPSTSAPATSTATTSPSATPTTAGGASSSTTATTSASTVAPTTTATSGGSGGSSGSGGATIVTISVVLGEREPTV